MSTEDNKAIVRRVIEEIWEKGNLAAVDELIAPNFVMNDPNFEVHGPEGFKEMVKATHTAFPDIQSTIRDQIAEGDKVLTRFTQRCTHKGEFGWFGIAPTGKELTIEGMEVVRIENGKLVERWVRLDLLGMLQQMDVMPALGGT
jgi:predicted ester cyclase